MPLETAAQDRCLAASAGSVMSRVQLQPALLPLDTPHGNVKETLASVALPSGCHLLGRCLGCKSSDGPRGIRCNARNGGDHDDVSMGLSLTRRLAHTSGAVAIERRRGVLRGGRCGDPGAGCSGVADAHKLSGFRRRLTELASLPLPPGDITDETKLFLQVSTTVTRNDRQRRDSSCTSRRMQCSLVPAVRPGRPGGPSLAR